MLPVAGMLMLMQPVARVYSCSQQFGENMNDTHAMITSANGGLGRGYGQGKLLMSRVPWRSMGFFLWYCFHGNG